MVLHTEEAPIYAHINIWPLNERGGSTDDTAAREIGTQLSQQPGFQSYTVVRTAEDEVVVMTVFDTREQLESAVHALAKFVHQRVAPLQAGEPKRRAGDVIYHTRA
jgi:heme-degrading monooxygenase HmoA